LQNCDIFSIYAKLSNLTLPKIKVVEGMRVYYGELFMESVTDHRNEVRTELVWPVSVWLPEANRFFNGQSSNISKRGVFVRMPMTTPVLEGNVVELNFPRTTVLAEQKGSYSRIKSGKVVRVEREDVPVDASIGVAVEFV